MEGSIFALVCFAFIVGSAVGLVATRFIYGDGGGNKAQSIQNQFDDYQREVIEHMDTTLELFKKLNHNYQELDQHLSSGVERLTLDNVTRDRLLDNFSNAPKSIEHNNASSNPPRDYAPKAAGEPGDLSRV